VTTPLSNYLAPTAPPGPNPPENISPPTVTYNEPYSSPGGVLSVTNGTWSNSPTSFTYEWIQHTGAALPNPQTSPSFIASFENTGFPAEAIRQVACIVTAHNDYGSTSITSNAVLWNGDSNDHFQIVPGRFQDLSGNYVQPGVLTMTYFGIQTGFHNQAFPTYFLVDGSQTRVQGANNSYPIDNGQESGTTGFQSFGGFDGTAPGGKRRRSTTNGFNTPFSAVYDNEDPPNYIRGGLPKVIAFPTISGSLEVGSTVSIGSLGTYNLEGSLAVNLSHTRWFVGGFVRANGSETYTIQDIDRGNYIYAEIRAALVGGTGASNPVHTIALFIPY
jgi:hypothetical protein